MSPRAPPKINPSNLARPTGTEAQKLGAMKGNIHLRNCYTTCLNQLPGQTIGPAFFPRRRKTMTTYGTHTYNTDVQGILILDGKKGGDGLQWEVSVTVTCTSPYVPAQLYGPPEYCDPAQGPEYEFDSFEFFVGKVVILRSKSWTVAEALFGANIWNHLYDDAVTDAEANPPEEEEP